MARQGIVIEVQADMISTLQLGHVGGKDLRRGFIDDGLTPSANLMRSPGDHTQAGGQCVAIALHGLSAEGAERDVRGEGGLGHAARLPPLSTLSFLCGLYGACRNERQTYPPLIFALKDQEMSFPAKKRQPLFLFVDGSHEAPAISAISI